MDASPKKRAQYLILAAAIFAATFIAYQQYAYLLGRRGTEFTYWNLLAQSFLSGKLYLVNPPTTHDLTLFMGNWYVPQPPLPAILMLPVVFLAGDVNTILFSIFFSALNSVLMFMILEQLLRSGWIKTSRNSILWLVLLFAFGTPHWYVGMDGRVWFLSQVLTVTFVALAILLALGARSPWLVGACLGAAIFARPNVIMIWPLLLAIEMQKSKEGNPKILVKPLALWAAKSVVPVVLFIFGLFAYNYLRFQNILDFGYATINGSDRLIQDVQTYGMFSFHFIPRNLEVIFLKLPTIQSSLPYVVPSIEGMSLFLTTPAFICLFRRYEKKIWIIGAWISVLLSVGMLSMYHNTGAFQFGYRYVLDFMVPLIMLLAATLKNKTPRLLMLLILISIIINEYSAWWFIRFINS